MNRIALILSTAFWLVMMFLLFKADVLPDYVVSEGSTYEDIVREIDTPIVREMAVFQGDVEVGTSSTAIIPEADGTYTIDNSTKLTVNLGVIQSNVQSILKVTLDTNRQLDRFYMKLHMGGKGADVIGVRDGDFLRLTIKLDGTHFEQALPYDKSMVSSYFNPFGLGGRLKEGQSWRTKFLDPLAQRVTVAEITVEGKEVIELSLTGDGALKKYEAYKVVMNWGTSQIRAWATAEGVVLKEETPWGYTLVYREIADDDKPAAGIEALRD